MKFTPQQALARVIDHREIFHDEMIALMRAIMGGEVSPVLTAAILAGLRVKKETVGEITGAARVMREFARGVPLADREHFLDIVGNRGDALVKKYFTQGLLVHFFDHLKHFRFRDALHWWLG